MEFLRGRGGKRSIYVCAHACKDCPVCQTEWDGPNGLNDITTTHQVQSSGRVGGLYHQTSQLIAPPPLPPNSCMLCAPPLRINL